MQTIFGLLVFKGVLSKSTIFSALVIVSKLNFGTGLIVKMRSLLETRLTKKNPLNTTNNMRPSRTDILGYFLSSLIYYFDYTPIVTLVDKIHSKDKATINSINTK